MYELKVLHTVSCYISGELGRRWTDSPLFLTLFRKMSQANGVAMSGAGVGSLVINIVLRDINEQHGWRGCMRMLGGLSAGLFVCGCMFRPPPDDFCGASQWSEWSKSVGLLTKLRRIFDSRPWKVKGFAMWVLAHSTILFAYFTPYVYLVSAVPILCGRLPDWVYNTSAGGPTKRQNPSFEMNFDSEPKNCPVAQVKCCSPVRLPT